MLSPQRIWIIIQIASAGFALVASLFSSNPYFQMIISGNVTAINIARVFKTTMWYVYASFFGVILAGSIYLWFWVGRTEKNEEIEELKREIIEMRADIRALVNRNRKSHSGKRTKRDNQA